MENKLRITKIDEFVSVLKSYVAQAAMAEDYTDQFNAIVELDAMFDVIKDCLNDLTHQTELAEQYKNWWLEERNTLKELKEKLAEK